MIVKGLVSLGATFTGAFPKTHSAGDQSMEIATSPRMMTGKRNGRIELLQGTLDLLVLRTLLIGSAHGQAIAKAIELNSEGVLVVVEGSLYAALHRLMKRGCILADSGISENNRKAKFYRLTAKGRKQLAVETAKWETLAYAISRILQRTACDLAIK